MATRPLMEHEYIQDGLIHCSVCKKPKQVVIQVPDNYIGVFRNETNGIYDSPCECQVKAAEEEKRLKLIEERRLKYIPIKKHREFRFALDDGQTPRTKLICERYVEKFDEMKKNGMGLLFFGDVGTGKTFYEYCIANELIDRGYSVTATSLLKIIHEAQQFKNDFDEKMSKYLENDLLIIDDIGTERDTGFANEYVYKFIDLCYASDIPILASTNKTLDEIQGEIDSDKETTQKRIYDRLLEKCFPVKLNKVKRRVVNSDINRKKMAEILGL
jgi:DNA replication protein DnaC